MKDKFVSRTGFEPASPRNTSRKKNVINVKGELINMTRARNKEKNLILKFLVPRLSHMTLQFTFHLTAFQLKITLLLTAALYFQPSGYFGQTKIFNFSLISIHTSKNLIGVSTSQLVQSMYSNFPTVLQELSTSLGFQWDLCRHNHVFVNSSTDPGTD